MNIEIVQTNHKQSWHARIKGDNGEIVWWTEKYAKRSDAIHAVALAAATFGVRGAYSVLGAPGNATLVFTATQFGGIPAERRFPFADIDERGDTK